MHSAQYQRYHSAPHSLSSAVDSGHSLDSIGAVAYRVTIAHLSNSESSLLSCRSPEQWQCESPDESGAKTQIQSFALHRAQVSD